MNEIMTCLIEKSPLLREGLKSLLIQADFVPLIEISSLEEFEEKMNHSGNQLVIFGAEPLYEAVAATVAAIKQKNSNSYIVILSEVADRESIYSSFSAGVDGFLLKDISAKAFLASLRLVMAGEKVFPTSMASAIVSDWDSSLKQDDCTPMENPEFSPRENDVIEHVAEGSSNKLIAKHLNITDATVKVHLKTILRKLKLSNRTQIAIWALKSNHCRLSRKIMQ